MITLEIENKSPFVPIFKRGIFFIRSKPLFVKEGKGRFMTRDLLSLPYPV
jgi:hypothetical protein